MGEYGARKTPPTVIKYGSGRECGFEVSMQLPSVRQFENKIAQVVPLAPGATITHGASITRLDNCRLVFHGDVIPAPNNDNNKKLSIAISSYDKLWLSFADKLNVIQSTSSGDDVIELLQSALADELKALGVSDYGFSILLGDAWGLWGTEPDLIKEYKRHNRIYIDPIVGNIRKVVQPFSYQPICHVWPRPYDDEYLHALSENEKDHEIWYWGYACGRVGASFYIPDPTGPSKRIFISHVSAELSSDYDLWSTNIAVSYRHIFAVLKHFLSIAIRHRDFMDSMSTSSSAMKDRLLKINSMMHDNPLSLRQGTTTVYNIKKPIGLLTPPILQKTPDRIKPEPISDSIKLCNDTRARLLAAIEGAPDSDRLVHFVRIANLQGFDAAVLDAISSISNEQQPLIELPEIAPELYINARTNGSVTNIIDFLRNVWMPWIDARVLTRNDLRRLDKSADTAVQNWIRKRDLPIDIVLPTKKTINDKLVSARDPQWLMALLKELRKLEGILRDRI